MTGPHPLLKQLTTERRTRGLTQLDAARRAGLGVTTIARWEQGSLPSLTALDLYLDALGLRLAVVPAATGEDEVPGEQLPYGELVLDASEKCCPCCRQVRPRRDFTRDRTRRDGVAYRCRFCLSERRRVLAEGRERAAAERQVA